MGVLGNQIHPSTLIVPHTNFIRSCSGISCIKSHITCSIASAVLGIFQAWSEKKAKGVNFTVITKLKNTVIKIKSIGRIMCLHPWTAAVSNSFSFWRFVTACSKYFETTISHLKFYDHHCVHDEDHAPDLKQFHITSLQQALNSKIQLFV